METVKLSAKGQLVIPKEIRDALHLALSAGDEAFATFDKVLGKVATQNGIAPQVRVLGR